MKAEERWHRLIANFQAGQISDEELAELEEALETSSTARELIHRAFRVDSLLRREANNRMALPDSEDEDTSIAVPFSAQRPFRRKSFFSGVATAAAAVLLFALTWAIAAQYRNIGTLVSSENAAWEGSGLSGEGAQLRRGFHTLTSGIATIRLKGGVDITLEAPVKLNVKGRKRVLLSAGVAVVKAVGAENFTLETLYGQAVISEGELLVFSSIDKSVVDFEVLTGAAVVSHDASREVVNLRSGGTAMMRVGSLDSSEILLSQRPLEPIERGLRIGTGGRSATFIRNNLRYRWTRPDILTLRKSSTEDDFDQYSVVAFNLENVDAARVEQAVLRVNLVPSGMGLASSLPKVNRFAVYGLINPAKENWSNADRWEEAPAPADGKLVGQFEIPRSQQAGTIEITGDLLFDFVREKAGRSASFVIVRETTDIEGKWHGLTHALASRSHPEAAGPVLEVRFKD